MKIIVDIPESIYETIEKDQFITRFQLAVLQSNIRRKGVPLPKGHGRLIDADKVADRLEELRDNWDYDGNEYESGIYTGCDYSLDEVMDAPTIIEADKTESEEV